MRATRRRSAAPVRAARSTAAVPRGALAGAAAMALLALAACSSGGADGKPQPSGADRPSRSAAAASSPAASSPAPARTAKPVTGADGVTSWDPRSLGREHVSGAVHYPTTPPVGGDHNPVWMECDSSVYRKPIPNENAVHSLEHGAVWVTYNEDADPHDVKSLAWRVARTPYALMSPVPRQREPLMMTAWGKQRSVRSSRDPAVNDFLRAYVQGPQTPEPGAPCTGGRTR